MSGTFEKLFPRDTISKRERVGLTLAHKAVDRVGILEQLSYNPHVIAMYTGKRITNYDYTIGDICEVIRQTTDMIMPPVPPRGTGQFTTDDGFTFQNDNWSTWRVSRPFHDVEGASQWLIKKTQAIRSANYNADCCWLPAGSSAAVSEVSVLGMRKAYRDSMMELQSKIGETVILNYSTTGMCSVFDAMGLELFTFFYMEYPEVMHDYMEAAATCEIYRIHAVADKSLSPVILIPEDFSTKGGPIFCPEFLHACHYPYIKRIAQAWHEHGITVLYHSDGNYKSAIEGLISCGVDGFYCLEPACGMDIVELKKKYPGQVWAGGIDGVELMERGRPEDVRSQVREHILKTDALSRGGMFVASSSEINPPVRPENFEAMVIAVSELYNKDFKKGK